MMVADLERYLNGESIRARTFSMIDRITWTLEHSQYDVQFGSYGTMLYWFAAIVMGTQIAKHVLLSFVPQQDDPVVWVASCQALQFALIGLAFFLYRGGGKGMAPTTASARQLE